LCGICGFIGFEDKALLKDMCRVVRHRGPDDQGYYIDANVSLGHNRLSIIDLKGGHQPIHNEDESIWVIYNGEIYNFIDIRNELEIKGHHFYTSSDTEAIVHLYEEYGTRLVDHLRGMFAFAIWDSGKKILVIGRDRLGIKPLYYTIIDGKFLFASEIKSILRYSEIKAAVNPAALHDYLTFRHTLSDETMFLGIKKLLPGHIMTYQDGKLSFTQYWDLPPAAAEPKPEDYYVKLLRKLLEESIRLHLISEVPLGVYLSGGIDSGIITALMNRIVDKPIETFSVGFGAEGEIGELSQAKITANYLGTNHHELVVEQGAFIKNMGDIIWHNDEPVADPSALAMFMLSKMAKKYVTVVLNGAGGDEIFGGYISYKIGLANQCYKRTIPGWLRRGGVNPIVKAVSPYLSSKFYVGLESISKEKKEEAFLFSKSVFSEEDKTNLYTAGLKEKINHDSFKKATDVLFKRKESNFLESMMYADTKSYLVDHILLETDKLTMSSSIEARVPLIDHLVVEFASSIPPDLKLRGLTEKYILKQVGSDILPPTLMKRKKRPFRIPIDTWFRGELDEMAKQVLDNSIIINEGYFKSDVVTNIIKKHKNAELLYNHQMYALLVFEMWHNEFIK